MAAPAGSGAVEAYSTTKVRGAKPSVSAAEFVPKASPEVEAKAKELHDKAIKNVWEAVSKQDPFRPTGEFAAAGELPADTLPKGGRKSRRRKTRHRKTRRRGGALSKPLPELMEDLARDPSKSTLENVISDFEDSGIVPLERKARELKARILAGAPVDALVREARAAIREVMVGGRRKTTRRRR